MQEFSWTLEHAPAVLRALYVTESHGHPEKGVETKRQLW